MQPETDARLIGVSGQQLCTTKDETLNKKLLITAVVCSVAVAVFFVVLRARATASLVARQQTLSVEPTQPEKHQPWQVLRGATAAAFVTALVEDETVLRLPSEYPPIAKHTLKSLLPEAIAAYTSGSFETIRLSLESRFVPDTEKWQDPGLQARMLEARKGYILSVGVPLDASIATVTILKQGVEIPHTAAYGVNSSRVLRTSGMPCHDEERSRQNAVAVSVPLEYVREDGAIQKLTLVLYLQWNATKQRWEQLGNSVEGGASNFSSPYLPG